MKPLVKTSGSKGLHIYVPIVRGPFRRQSGRSPKALAVELASRHPALMTSEYKVAKRPKGRVLVDYNQNAWGRTLASIYSVRPTPLATVSTPLDLEGSRGGRQDRRLPARQRPRSDQEERRSLEAAAGVARANQPEKRSLLPEQLGDRFEIVDPSRNAFEREWSSGLYVCNEAALGLQCLVDGDGGLRAFGGRDHDELARRATRRRRHRDRARASCRDDRS